MPHKKTHHRRKTHKKKGGYYGATGAIAPGAMEWGRGSEMGDFAISTRGANAMYGARRKKKGGRKGRKTRKGGASYGAVSASFQGNGQRGLIDVAQTTTKYPPFGGASQGAFNNAGAQPGSGFGSFIRAH